MKRSTIVASVAAFAVVGGAAVASASLTGSEGSTAAQELQAVADSEQEGPAGAQDGKSVQGGTADGNDDRDDDRDDRDDDGGGRDGSAAGGAADGSGVAEQVIATALEAAPGHVVEVDLDRDDQRWDVEIAGDDGREHEVDVSLDGTEVLYHEKEREDDVRGQHKLLAGAEISAADAARIAEERLGGHVTDIDLDEDDRVWEVDVRDADGVEWEMDIDLKTGEISELEQDD